MGSNNEMWYLGRLSPRRVWLDRYGRKLNKEQQGRKIYNQKESKHLKAQLVPPVLSSPVKCVSRKMITACLSVCNVRSSQMAIWPFLYEKRQFWPFWAKYWPCGALLVVGCWLWRAALMIECPIGTVYLLYDRCNILICEYVVYRDLINLWGNWIKSCKATMPEFQLHSSYIYI